LPAHNHEIHHEIELGFIVAKRGRYIKAADADSYVGGYFLALDLTDRDLQGHFKK
jgi:acylpyruvate hydrolase